MSLWHWIIVALVILVLFGRGKISEMMGDFGKGVSSFKKGLADAEAEVDVKQVKQLAAGQPSVEPVREGPAAPARTPEEEAAAKRDPGT